jgi:hypothetical protein
VANYIRSLGGNTSSYLADTDELKKLAAMELATDRLVWQDEPDLPPLEPDDGLPMNIYPDDPDYLKSIDESQAPDLPDPDGEDDDAGEASDQVFDPQFALEQFQDLLANALPDLLEVDDNFFIAQFNYQLINLLVDYPDFKDRLIGVLLNHSLQLGTDNLMIDGRQLAPTVGAWINYFINQKGSIMFDAITLSDFLITAASAKLLSPLDKDHLSRLLWLYRNLKFFPDSLVGDDPANWELLTYVSEEANLTSPAPTSSPSTNPASPITSNPLADKIKALEQLAAQYPAGGLERLAIEEEIKRLQAS